MNIDFSNDPGFSTYVVLLVLSGVVMLGLSSVRQGSRGLRLLNIAFGAGFVCYGFYLAFLFQGGSYMVFFKAFILPVVMVFKTVKSRLSQSSAPQAAAPTHVVAPATDPEVAVD